MSQAYFENLLTDQTLTSGQLSTLRDLRNDIQAQLSVLQGGPRFYYGGSFAKNTMIRARFDLDIVMYWPHVATSYTLGGIYQAVGGVLKKHWTVTPRNVCWEIPFQGGFHIDVVPGRALDATFIEANLHRQDTGTTLKTSLKKHIKHVRDSGRVPAIRLMKLWRHRRQVPFKKSFLLEVMTIEACKGIPFGDYSQQLGASLRFIRDNILTRNFYDPANNSNSLTDDLDQTSKIGIKRAAEAALAATTWAAVLE
jgi:hypothetical protein